MKVGDLVRHVFGDELIVERMEMKIGIIVERVFDPLASTNDVFNVVWRNGSLGKNVWDYDLVAINESR